MYGSSVGGGSGGFVIPTSNSRPSSPQQSTTESGPYASNGGHGYKRPAAAAGYGMDEQQVGKRMRMMSDTAAEGTDGGFASGARHPPSTETEDIIAGIRGAISAGSNNNGGGVGAGGYAPMGYSTIPNAAASGSQAGMYFSHPSGMPHQHQHQQQQQQHRTTHSQTPHLSSDQNNLGSPNDDDAASDSEGSDADQAHNQHGGGVGGGGGAGGQGYVRFTADSEAPGADGSVVGDNDEERKRPKMTRGSR